MIQVLIVSQALAWLVIVALVVTMLALVRQIGVLHTRLAPAGALTGGGAAAPGTIAPPIHAPTLAGGTMLVGGEASDRLRLVFFASPACPLCKTLLPIARSFARAERLTLIVAGDDREEALRRMAAAHRLDPAQVVNSAELGRAWRVDRLPHAVLLGPDGRIAARGLVNSREHLESLILAHESGVGSIQDHLTRHDARLDRTARAA